MGIRQVWQQAREAGHSDQDIFAHLQGHAQVGPLIKQAREAGHDDEQIMSHLSGTTIASQERVPEAVEPTSAASSLGRAAGELALGVAEATPIGIATELATAPLASEDAQLAAFRGTLSDDLERLLDQKASGVWDQQDQEQLDNTINLLKNPSEARKYVQTVDLSLQKNVERLTGVDLTPNTAVEKAARWTGWIRNPANVSKISKLGIGPKALTNAIAPTGKEALRGLGAGTMLQLAEDENFGPIGTVAAGLMGDLLTGGAVSGVKAIGRGLKQLATEPKRAIAKGLAKLTKNEKNALSEDIINEFRQAGIQPDIGTITESNMMKVIQSRLAQSGLTGEGLQNLKDQMTNQFKTKYGEIANTLGELQHTTQFEAGQALQNMAKTIRDTDLGQVRGIYEDARNILGAQAKTDTSRLANRVAALEARLEPGSIKSAGQKSVLSSLADLKNDLSKVHPEGKLALVEDLINNKIALNDIINYEVQGGAQQLLKDVVKELDRAIIGHGTVNKRFADNYIRANKQFSEHARTFRNKNIDKLLRTQDPAVAFNMMNSVQGIRDVKKALSLFAEGQDLFNSLRRFKLEEMIGKNMVDSTTKQMKFGTFAKLLEKPKNRELIKELIGPSELKKLERLQRNSGRLAESANKFFNSSQSGSQAVDAAVILKGFNSILSALAGNPWPLLKTVGAVNVSRRIANLISDKDFLRAMEDAVIAVNSGNTRKINSAYGKLVPFFESILNEREEALALLIKEQATNN